MAEKTLQILLADAILRVLVIYRAKRSRIMETANSNTKLQVSIVDAGRFVPSFSIPGSVFRDAEKQSGMLYSVLMENGVPAGSALCIGLDCSGLICTDSIRVKVQPCVLFRVVEEKVTGFVTVVRRSWNRIKHKYRAAGVFCRWTRQTAALAPPRGFVLSYAGGLRL